MSSKHRHYSPQYRKKLIRRRATIIASAVCIVAAIVFTIVLLTGNQAVPTSGPVQSGPSASEPSASEDKESSSSDASESQEESPESSAPESSGNESVFSETEISIPEDAPAYQKKYPDLYVKDRPKLEVLDDSEKVVYLTFDDGPSDLTEPLLDVLKEHNAKATFFNCHQSDYQAKYSYLMKRCVDEGHTVAVHTYSHVMNEVYSSVDAYLDDFYKMYKDIEEVTGKEPANFFRFPGGSKNGYNQKVYQDIIKEMTRRGFIYYDWDGDSGDASGGNVPGETIYQNSMDAIRKGCNIILMHNIFGKKSTLDQVGRIIETAQKEGYEFRALDGTLDPSHWYLMTTDEFVDAAIESPLIQLSDWRMELEAKKKTSGQ